MASFKEYFEHQGFIEFVLNEFDSPNPAYISQPQWSAKKSEIMQSWKNLRPNVPIYMTPMSKSGDHGSYGEDGIRISGSWQFIASILGKLKELIQFENEQTRLRLVFRGVEGGSPGKQSFVFYVNVENRQKSSQHVKSPE